MARGLVREFNGHCRLDRRRDTRVLFAPQANAGVKIPVVGEFLPTVVNIDYRVLQLSFAMQR